MRLRFFSDCLRMGQGSQALAVNLASKYQSRPKRRRCSVHATPQSSFVDTHWTVSRYQSTSNRHSSMLVEECDAHRQVFGAVFFSGFRCPSTGGVLVSSRRKTSRTMSDQRPSTLVSSSRIDVVGPRGRPRSVVPREEAMSASFLQSALSPVSALVACVGSLVHCVDKSRLTSTNVDWMSIDID